MASLSPSPKMQFFSANGVPLAGGKLYTYVAGGLTVPQVTYTDSTGGTPNTNPIILDSRGEANVWLVDGSFYALKLTDSVDSLIWTADNVSGILTSTSVHNLSSKTTPIDPDELVITDSAAAFSLKKLTWANLVATLRSTFAANPFSVGNATATANAPTAGQIQSQSLVFFSTGGTSSAYTLSPAPAITAYTDGMSFQVAFNAACAITPHITISGLVASLSLVKRLADGTLSTLAANDITAGHISKITVIGGGTQALVHQLPSAAVVTATTTNQGISQLATVTEAATGTDASKTITPSTMMGAFNKTGTAPAYLCRAWCTFIGSSGAVINGGNVSSVTRTSAGLYTANFSTALPDNGYAVTFGASSDSAVSIGIAGSESKLAGSFVIRTGSSGTGASIPSDRAAIDFSVFR